MSPDTQYGGVGARAPDGGVSPLPPTGTLQQAYLHAGHMVVSSDPCRVTTVLGSCVAVGLWDPTSGVGGVNHFLLPQGSESARFGNVAVRTLIREVVAAGGRRRSLQAKLFGGACVLRAFKSTGAGRASRPEERRGRAADPDRRRHSRRPPRTSRAIADAS